MFAKDMIELLKGFDPETEVMVKLSDCELVSPVSYVEEYFVEPDARTGLYRDDLEQCSKKIAVIGYDF